MDNENSRNTITFAVIAMLMLLAYNLFVLQPAEKKRAAELAHQRLVTAQQAALPTPATVHVVTRGEALAQSARVKVAAPALTGSISLKGARIDDLFLAQYPVSLDKGAPKVELFRPEGVSQAYFAEFGWAGAPGVPNATTVWTQTGGDVLSPGHPVILTYDNGQGLVFTRTIAVDEHFMFTLTDEVANRGPAPVTLAAYGSVQHQGKPTLTPNILIHEGGVGALGEKHELRLQAFKDWKGKGDSSYQDTGGWVGLTDKYWLAAVIPDQQASVKGGFRISTVNGVDVYEANFVGQPHVIAPGGGATETRRLFAGAKRVDLLQAYQRDLNIPNLDNAVDWGNLWFITRPVFWLLSTFHGLTGNWGVAILLMTLVVKIALFPLAKRGFDSASKMKQLQPKLEEIRKKHEKDPAKVQQETMALYQAEKVNPLAGCLPILVQIPILYALSKVLWVSAEMRQAPFFGWIHDLSARDDSTFVNLFGLIPWDPGATPLIGGILGGVLHIGVWPLLYGFTQWLSTSMTPPASSDPSQKIVYQMMPVVFTVMMAQTPSGLLIYWAWSGALTVLQQYVIMHRAGVENPIDGAISRLLGRRGKALQKAA
jgi:YidC/Oxa1 family membrane protein insertase